MTKDNPSYSKRIDLILNELLENMRDDNIDEWEKDLYEILDIFYNGKKINRFEKSLLNIKGKLKLDIQTKQDDEQEIEGLAKLKKHFRLIRKNEADMLLNHLMRIGHSIASNKKDLSRELVSSALKITELIRLGKRDAVIGTILRIFIAQKENLPPEITETLQDRYDDDHFRAFMYGFMGNFTQLNKEEKNND